MNKGCQDTFQDITEKKNRQTTVKINCKPEYKSQTSLLQQPAWTLVMFQAQAYKFLESHVKILHWLGIKSY
jgi:hypothetical protein